MRGLPAVAVLIRTGVVLLVVAGTASLVLWLMGAFTEKVTPTGAPARVLPSAEGVPTVPVETVRVAVVDEAVGSIRAAHEIRIASRLLARVAAMHVTAAGQQVSAGEVLVELEDADLRAAVLEARAALSEAEEAHAQAERDLARTRELHEREIAAESELETQSTRAERARAAAEAARQALAAAETRLSFSVIRSPIDGTVIDKSVQEGDTVGPGETLLTMYDPSSMQLVAAVREERASSLSIGQEVEVAIDALALRCRGTVSEIVPRAEAGSRAFDVKVTGDCPDGVFTGMFGRLLLDVGYRDELRIPTSAVRSVGQVDLVWTVTDGHLLRRFVVLGETVGDRVVVHSGLAPGEAVALDADAVRVRKAAR